MLPCWTPSILIDLTLISFSVALIKVQVCTFQLTAEGQVLVLFSVVCFVFVDPLEDIWVNCCCIIPGEIPC